MALALVALLAFAVPAFAASFSTGDYGGRTKQKNGKGKHRRISFHADFDADEITGIKFVETGKCKDGTTTIGKQKDLSAPVLANGTFTVKASSSNGGTKLSLKGKIAGTKASGSFIVKSRYKKHATKPNKHGKVRCSTGKVKWSAKLGG